MQAALDSTALMLSKEATADTSGQLQTNALKYFDALFTRPAAASIVDQPRPTRPTGGRRSS